MWLIWPIIWIQWLILDYRDVSNHSLEQLVIQEVFLVLLVFCQFPFQWIYYWQDTPQCTVEYTAWKQIVILWVSVQVQQQMAWWIHEYTYSKGFGISSINGSTRPDKTKPANHTDQIFVFRNLEQTEWDKW